MSTLSRRDLARRAAAALTVALSPRAFAARDDDLAFIAPELRPMARDILQQSANMPPLSTGTLPAMRKAMGAGAPWARPPPAFAQRVIDSPHGAPPVTIYIVNAKQGQSRPAILHTHGGGFVMGDAKSMLADLDEMAQALDCVVVTVDYRLAPETTFSGSIEDNYTALRWLHVNAAELGADPTRLAVMGESAGGGHAALLALTARDRGEVPLVLQVLIYPMLDDRTGSVRHPPSPIGKVLWTAEANRFGWRSFLGQAPGTSLVPVRAVPARQSKLAGLPPAFIGVGSIDLFVDEDIEYGRRLIDAGVPAELVVVPGAYHGFDGIAAHTSIAQQFRAEKLAALRRAFSPA